MVTKDKIVDKIKEMFVRIIGTMSDVTTPFKSAIVAAICLTALILISSGFLHFLIRFGRTPWNLLEFWTMVGGIIGFCWIMFMWIAVMNRQRHKEIKEKLEKMKKELR